MDYISFKSYPKTKGGGGLENPEGGDIRGGGLVIGYLIGGNKGRVMMCAEEGLSFNNSNLILCLNAKQISKDFYLGMNF